MKDLFEYYIEDVNRPFEGWDFSYIHGRMSSFPLSWNYQSTVSHEMLSADTMLDMGTGGGEFLYAVRSLLPKHTYATEAYEPNAPIAKEKLSPMGVEVSQISSDEALPYAQDMFDLIINRHESYSVKEVKRILKENGIFITQQVGGENDLELNQWLGAAIDVKFRDWNLEHALTELEQECDIVDAKEEKVKNRFYDIGAIVYYLKAIPWQIPDFTVEKYKEPLFKLHKHILDHGYIDSTCHRFLIKAVK